MLSPFPIVPVSTRDSLTELFQIKPLAVGVYESFTLAPKAAGKSLSPASPHRKR
jgi:hypothetical protein